MGVGASNGGLLALVKVGVEEEIWETMGVRAKIRSQSNNISKTWCGSIREGLRNKKKRATILSWGY